MVKKNSKIQKQNFDSPSFDISTYQSDRWSSEKEFAEHVGVEIANIKKAGISWQELASIYLDQEKNTEALQSIANAVLLVLQKNEYASGIKTRVKDPSKLVQKIIRKRLAKKDVNFQNYKREISDLVGVRVLHVLKKEWLFIHNTIINTFRLFHNKVPTAYLTHSDVKIWKPMYIDNNCNCEESERDYRSVHYDVELSLTKENVRLEIQVRTINEEAWGELDHKINYPIPASEVVGDFIKASNMLSSTADHLSQQIISVHSELSKMHEEQVTLKLERDSALHEVKDLLSKLAKTEDDKKKARKAFSDLTGAMTVSYGKDLSAVYTSDPFSAVTARTQPGLLQPQYPLVGNAFNTGPLGATLKMCEKCRKILPFYSALTECDDCRTSTITSVTGSN